jgi:lysozyme
MQLGSAGLALIKQFEGCRLTAYQDQRGIWTIGYGQTGPGIAAGLTWTQAQADAALLSATQTASNALLHLIDIAMAQNQFDALTSLVFNIGVGNFGSSTLLKLLNQNHIPQAADQFLVWDHVNGAPDPGLLRRRQAERTLFLTP